MAWHVFACSCVALSLAIGTDKLKCLSSGLHEFQPQSHSRIDAKMLRWNACICKYARQMSHQDAAFLLSKVSAVCLLLLPSTEICCNASRLAFSFFLSSEHLAYEVSLLLFNCVSSSPVTQTKLTLSPQLDIESTIFRTISNRQLVWE